MSKLSKQQEKKRKQRERERRNKNPQELAYYGNKYRTEALLPTLMDTETAILEAFILFDRQLTDHDVSRGLVRLIDSARHGKLRLQHGPISISHDDPTDAVVQLVCARWQNTADRLPGRDNLIGVLRTILGSVQNRKNPSPESRNYLNFIERFLAELGVRVQAVPESEMEGRGAPPMPRGSHTIDAEFEVPPPSLPR